VLTDMSSVFMSKVVFRFKFTSEVNVNVTLTAQHWV